MRCYSLDKVILYKTLSYQTGGRQTLLLALKKLQYFEMARDCGRPLDAKSSFWLTATKKMGTSVLQSQMRWRDGYFPHSSL